jgi:hypothetical protein
VKKPEAKGPLENLDKNRRIIILDLKYYVVHRQDSSGSE